jgi:hypothetical protein
MLFSARSWNKVVNPPDKGKKPSELGDDWNHVAVVKYQWHKQPSKFVQPLKASDPTLLTTVRKHLCNQCE